MTLYIVVNQFGDRVLYIGPSVEAAERYANQFSSTQTYEVAASKAVRLGGGS